MKYKVLGFINGSAKLFVINPNIITGVEPIELYPEGPEGAVAKMITPEEVKVQNEKVVDVSLDGIINKNKEEK